MPLTPGDQLGPYEILAPLGAGGMGQVWKARDSRLDRIVAVKTSSAQFSERFEREARAVAALNHPNICQLHDVGPNYLVMEFIEGAPVVPPDSPRKLLDMAVQIADGLAAAHAAGIIHRDLKPDNILMTREGRIKILDFGLAKRAPENAAPTDATVTVARALTDPGSTIGTIAYMSPEQARGEVNLSPQSDQFSLGLVLYELAAGKKAFPRGSAAEIMTAIIREDAEPLPPAVPAAFRWIVEQLLSKEPADRYDSTRDLYRELRKVRDRLSESTSASAVAAVQVAAPQRTRRNWLAFALIAALLALAVALGVLFLTPKPHNAANDIYTPIETSLENPSDPSWSPDGKSFTYSAIFEGKRQVFVRYLNATLSTRLTNLSSDVYALGWAPDGKRIFLAAANPKAGSWPLVLSSVSIAGGEPELLAPLDVFVRLGSVDARVSPDGKVLLGPRRESDGTYSLNISSPVGSPWKRYAPAPFETKQITNRPSSDLSPDGKKIVYFLTNNGENQAWLLPFPPGSGTPKRILDGNLGPAISFSWFPDSRHIAANTGTGDRRFLRLLDTEGAEGKPITGGMVNQTFPTLSPDGRRMLFLESTSDYRIVAASLKDASVRTRVRSQLRTGMPLWAAKGERFVYDTSSHGEPEIWLRESDGAERPVLTQSAFPPGTGSRFVNPALSPHGGRLAVTRIPPKGPNSIWIASLAGGTPVRLTNGDSADEYMGVWSPDGARIVYRRLEEGTVSLMIAKTSGQATPVELVRTPSLLLPDWSPTGEWIVYASAPGTWALISPDGKDGKAKRDLGKIATQHLTFSKDGKMLYGIRAEGDHQYLFSLTIATGQMKTIGDVGSEFAPRSYMNTGIRFSLSPDGQSILYPTNSTKTGLWMLEGFAQP